MDGKSETTRFGSAHAIMGASAVGRRASSIVSFVGMRGKMFALRYCLCGDDRRPSPGANDFGPAIQVKLLQVGLDPGRGGLFI